jgi:hypothetical protein
MKQTTGSDKLLKAQQAHIENESSYTSTMKFKQLGRGASGKQKNAITLQSTLAGTANASMGPTVPPSISSNQPNNINFFNPPLQTSVNSHSTTNQSNINFRGSSENISSQAAGIVYEGRPKRKKNSLVKAYASQTSHGHHGLPSYSNNNISAILINPSENTT